MAEGQKYIGKKGIRPYRDEAILIMIQSMEVSIPQLIAMNLEDLTERCLCTKTNLRHLYL